MDTTQTNPGYVDRSYLDKAAEALATFKRRTYALMQIHPGHRVLDVGCGPATDTLALAELTGPAGRVTGIDYDGEMIVLARQKAIGVSGYVTHEKADATDLPFADSTFDSCRCERVLQHLDNSELAVSEMVRVTKPGGWIVIADADHSSVSIDTPESDIEWRMRRVRVEQLRNGYSGRTLYRLFKMHGLMDIHIEFFPYPHTDYHATRFIGNLDRIEAIALEQGVVTQEELIRLRTAYEQAQQAGFYWGYAVMILAAGRKP